MFDEYLAQIENATEDSARLGELRAEITGAPGLDDEESAELLGRIATYLGDLRGVDDPHQRAEYGMGEPPLTPPDEWAGLAAADDDTADDT